MYNWKEFYQNYFYAWTEIKCFLKHVPLHSLELMLCKAFKIYNI